MTAPRVHHDTILSPEAARRKDQVEEVAYREFCERIQSGEAVDPDQFCGRFPAVRSALTKMIQCHLYFAQYAELDEQEKSVIPWPMLDSEYLGFHLLLELGRGAFGRVFLAREVKLGNRLVAVKIAQAGGAAEANLLGKLKHPNIVPVYSVQSDEYADLTAVCMPYLGSATLDDVIDRVYAQPGTRPTARDILAAAQALKFPVDIPGDRQDADPYLRAGAFEDAVRSLGAQIAEALAFMHELGICHRDLKPSNVLMTPAGVPMLLDFNLSNEAKNVNSLFGGTMPYMSPEQLQATDADGHHSPALLDGRSDIFSLGVMLFQLLTGEHPFGPISLKWDEREMREILLQRYLQGAPNPRTLSLEIDAEFAALIERCMAYNPNDRPQTAAEIARALRHDLKPRCRARRWVSRHPSIVAACLAMLMFGATGAAVATIRTPGRVHPMEMGASLYERKQFAEARDAFNQAMMADPTRFDAVFALGRTYQQMGNYQIALKYYLDVDKGAPNAENTACIAHCLLRDGLLDAANRRFQLAIDQGFESAEIHNDLGYAEMRGKRDGSQSAEMHFNRAIEINPRLQSAYLNRAELRWKQAVSRGNMAIGEGEKAVAARSDVLQFVRDGIGDVKKALDVGPVNADMHELAARLYAVGAAHGLEKAVERGCEQLEMALKIGLPPQQLDKFAFATFRDDSRFKDLKSRPNLASQVSETKSTDLILDPIGGRLR